MIDHHFYMWIVCSIIGYLNVFLICYMWNMQELSAIVPAKEKQTIIKTAITKVESTNWWYSMSSFISFYPLKMFRLLALVFIYLSFLFFFSLSDLNRSPILLVFMFLLTPFWAFWQFRAAIQLQFDFHRAIYNLGTVLVCFSTDLTLHEVQFLDLCTKCQHEINCVDSMG
jgi:hypothetical protein